MTLSIGRRVHVNLDDADRRVGVVVGDPLGRDERFRPCVIRQRVLLLVLSVPGRRHGAGVLSSGSLAASHAAIPPASSTRSLKPCRCKRLAAIDER